MSSLSGRSPVHSSAIARLLRRGVTATVIAKLLLLVVLYLLFFSPAHRPAADAAAVAERILTSR